MTSNTEARDPEFTDPESKKNPAKPVLIGASIVAVIALAASVWFGIGWKSAAADQNIADVRDSALAGAQQAAINLSSVDSANLDGSLDTMMSSVTGDEMTNYLDETRSSISDEQRNSGRKITAEVIGSSLTELNVDDKTATAVLIVANLTTGPDDTAPERSRAVMRMFLQDVDGTWKVNKLLPVGDRAPIGDDNARVYNQPADGTATDPNATADPNAPADPNATADPSAPAAVPDTSAGP